MKQRAEWQPTDSEFAFDNADLVLEIKKDEVMREEALARIGALSEELQANGEVSRNALGSAPWVADWLLAEAVVGPGIDSGNGDGNLDGIGNSNGNGPLAPKIKKVENQPLKAKIKGFYPFPGGVPEGFLGWLFRDVHQAVVVSSGPDRLLVDFMTAGGMAHPVWWDENVKWRAFFGGEIEAEVRLRNIGKISPSGSKMGRLREWLLAYGSQKNLRLYTSNCRVFACRVVREVERLNAEDEEDVGSLRATAAELMADVRLAFGLFRAGLLPAAYPLAVLALCWPGLAPFFAGS